jgi:hypothetical protein
MLETYDAPAMLFPVCDREVAGIRYKQKAECKGFSVHEDDELGCLVRMTIRLWLYAPDAEAPDGYGPRVEGEGFTYRPRELKADDDTLVDAATGEILAERAKCSTEQWAAVRDDPDRAVMGQGNFFQQVRDLVPFINRDLIAQHVHQANAMGRFD